MDKSIINVKKLGIILSPTNEEFEKTAVLNPGCFQEGNFVHMFYRAIDGENHSTIGYAKLNGPLKVVERLNKPFMTRSFDYEKNGIEDPRIAKINGTYYMTYVAHDGKNAITFYAISKDLKKFQKKGLISPTFTYHQSAELFRKERLKDRYLMFESYYSELSGPNVLLWFKDVILFPEKINGKFAMLLRILPDIQLVLFKNFKELQQKKFWKDYLMKLSHNVILENKYWFESRNIGGGAPPIKTKYGWLLIFHSVEELNKARIYHASCALLDKNNPLKVIARPDKPLFSPQEIWEKEGLVDSVVFPTGTAVFGNNLYIYYGAADKHIAVARINLQELLKKIKLSS